MKKKPNMKRGREEQKEEQVALVGITDVKVTGVNVYDSKIHEIRKIFESTLINDDMLDNRNIGETEYIEVSRMDNDDIALELDLSFRIGIYIRGNYILDITRINSEIIKEYEQYIKNSLWIEHKTIDKFDQQRMENAKRVTLRYFVTNSCESYKYTCIFFELGQKYVIMDPTSSIESDIIRRTITNRIVDSSYRATLSEKESKITDISPKYHGNINQAFKEAENYAIQKNHLLTEIKKENSDISIINSIRCYLDTIKIRNEKKYIINYIVCRCCNREASDNLYDMIVWFTGTISLNQGEIVGLLELSTRKIKNVCMVNKYYNRTEVSVLFIHLSLDCKRDMLSDDIKCEDEDVNNTRQLIGCGSQKHSVKRSKLY
jgi:hypothetical protein